VIVIAGTARNRKKANLTADKRCLRSKRIFSSVSAFISGKVLDFLIPAITRDHGDSKSSLVKSTSANILLDSSVLK
jgi:hypothetical protein